jgi:hypothetical protein
MLETTGSADGTVLNGIATGSRARVFGEGRTVQWSERAINLLIGERMVSLLGRGGTLAPSNILVDADTLPQTQRVVSTPEGLRAGDLAISWGQEVDLGVEPRPLHDREQLRDAIAPLARPKAYSIMSAVAVFEGGGLNTGGLEGTIARWQLEALRTSTNRRQLAERLVGSGYGLTPSGDDFLLGAIAVLHMEGEDTGGVRQAVQRYRNPFGRTMLMDGLDGHFSLPVKELLSSSAVGDVDEDGLRAVLRLGHTSGLDTLAGMYFVLRWDPGP